MSAAGDVQEPDCLKCAHYFITHDAGFPYGCRAMTFKSRRLPRIEVEMASNAICLAYLRKPLKPRTG